MNKDLTASTLHRQNVLNNRFAVERMQDELSLGGIKYKDEPVFTKVQVAEIFNVDERTIERYLSSHGEELAKNGYELLQGNTLKDFKNLALTDINVAQSTKALGIFSFKSVLNLAMLLTESDRARQIRSRILDVVIDVINQKATDRTYINQRDEDYLPAAFQEENYRKQFTDAIDAYINSNQAWKYGKYTNLIYKAIFKEDAREYRQILKLSEKDRTRDTFYAPVLDVIASFEGGYAEALKDAFEEKGDKLSVAEADALFQTFANQKTLEPFINKARTIMASRDHSLRDVIHEKLKVYIQAMPEADYERFLGEKSKALEERIQESLEVYKRLKDR